MALVLRTVMHKWGDEKWKLFILGSWGQNCYHLLNWWTLCIEFNDLVLGKESGSKAKFRRRTSYEPNQMQIRKILCSPSLAFNSAHVKYGVWTGPKGRTEYGRVVGEGVYSCYMKNALPCFRVWVKQWLNLSLLLMKSSLKLEGHPA